MLALTHLIQLKLEPTMVCVHARAAWLDGKTVGPLASSSWAQIPTE